MARTGKSRGSIPFQMRSGNSSPNKFLNLGNFVGIASVPYTHPPKIQVQWYLFQSHLGVSGGGG